ncbi:MAG: ABC transporter permease [Acidobacteriota bacterium]|nr:ABC transporter permease [Acidobacteriota bacterium]
MFEVTRRLLRYRGLLATLVVRELKARYRGSVLGFFWSLVNPLLMLAVYSFVFTVIFKPRFAGADLDPYPLFLMTGLFPWIWVSTSMLEGSQSLMANAGLIRKAVFPAEILPMIAVFANLVHFLLALPILAAGLAVGRYLGHPVAGWWSGALPVVVVLEFFAVGGITLALAALNVHFKDIRDILINVLSLLLYLTPILYPLQQLPRAGRWAVHWLNPFAPFATAFQEVVFHGDPLRLGLVAHMVGWAIVLWALGSWLFHRLSDNLVEAV